MRDDFCAFILTHGRPDRVYTHRTLLRAGYTGKLYLVVDDEDATAEAYRERFGAENVLSFSKRAIAETFDEADNFENRKAIVYARNACFDLAKAVGCRYFIQLDDDYNCFFLRYSRAGEYVSCRVRTQLDAVLEAMVDFYEATGANTFCMSQGGDHLGGAGTGIRPIRLCRKAMNTFICSTDRRFVFRGRINEDVNTYAEEGRRGGLFLTALQVQVNQQMTQASPGGMTETYLEAGTYLKSFYSVIFCPSAVRVGEISDPRSPHRRIHHRINWHACVPKILREGVRKPSPEPFRPASPGVERPGRTPGCLPSRLRGAGGLPRGVRLLPPAPVAAAPREP